MTAHIRIYEAGGIAHMDYPKELERLTSFLRVYENVGDITGQAACYGALGAIQSAHANYADATLNLYKAAKLFNSIGWYKYETIMYYVIALNTFIAYKSEDARNLFKRVIPSFIEFEMDEFIGLSYLGISRTFNRDLAFDSCFVYLNKSLEIEQNLDNCNSLKSEILMETGHTYLFKGNYVKSTEFYQESYLSAIDVGFDEMIILASTCLGQSYSLNGDYELADTAFNYSEESALKLGNIYYLEEIYKEKMDHFKRVGNPEMIEKYTLLHEGTHDSIFSLSNKSEYNNSLNEIEILTLENENLYKENELKELGILQAKQQNEQLIWTIVLISVLIILFLITFFTIRNSRIKGRLIEQNKRVSEYEKRLLTTQLSQKELQADRLSSEVELKEGKLTNFAMELIAANEFSKKVLSKLRGLIESDSAEVDIRELVSFLKHQLEKGDANNNEFDARDINEAFFQRLSKKEKKFTMAEKGILGMIRIGMSSKDIAEIKNIQVNSVEIYRHRLRKKLDLKRDENLVSFLREI
ncbi:MAG: DNA-binding CsgD family transcriptional regulator [Crocinitomix sp.]|jgi:DNA-binding CsgD family transcriptional regulator